MIDPPRLEEAIRTFWTVRRSQAAKQLASGRVDAGARGAVTGGVHLERLYDAACFVASSADESIPVRQPLAELGFDNFVAAVAGRAAYIKALAAGRPSSQRPQGEH